MTLSHEHGHEHDHGHVHSHGITHSHGGSSENIGIAFLLNLFFAIAEFIGGLIIHSTAVLSDSVHDLGDSISLAAAFVLEKKSVKKPNDRYTYGYRRLSVVGAMITTLTLAIGTLFALYEAIKALSAPPEVKTAELLIFAAAGIIINAIPVLRMRKSIKISERAVTLHLLEDVLGWLGVLAAGIVMHFTGFYLLDPILSLIICAFMVWNIAKNIGSIHRIIMQSSPDGLDIAEVREKLEGEGLHIEKINVWSLDGENNVASVQAHIECSCGRAEHTREAIISARKALEGFGIQESTIELTEA